MGTFPSEKELKQAYAQKLQASRPGDPYSQSSISSFVGAVTAAGYLTKLVREVPGLLPDEIPSLLAVRDRELAQKIAHWWEAEGSQLPLKKDRKSQMKLWITVWQELPLTEARASRSHTRKLPLQPPPHGVRLLFLLQAFFPRTPQQKEENHTDYRMGSYDIMLRILKNAPSYCDTNDFKEDTAAFAKLRRDILTQLETNQAHIARALGQAFSLSELKRNCREVVNQCMAVHGLAILADGLQRPEGILSALERLHTAPGKELPNAFLALVHTVLQDCDPSTRSSAQPDAPSAPLRLWQGQLVWHWLEHSPPSPQLLEFLLQRPLPEHHVYRRRLVLDLFRGMLACAQPPKGRRAGRERWDQAEHWIAQALAYMQNHWDSLQSDLSQGSPYWWQLSSDPAQLSWDALSPPPRKTGSSWWSVVPEQRLQGGPLSCVFRAELLLQQAEIAMGHPGDSDHPHRRGHRLMVAREAIRQADNLLRKRLDERQSASEYLAGQKNASYPLLVRLYLREAECYLALAQLEEEENCLDDGVKLYILPARTSLCSALDSLETIHGQEQESLRALWIRVQEKCASAFFSPTSSFVKRMRLRGQQDFANYQAEFQRWQDDLACKSLPVTAPKVVRPLDPAALQSADLFEAVYSGVFDSVPGKDPGHQVPMELSMFQLLASGKTSLLQMNQVVDNRCMLQLMFTPGFRAACRKGIITLSCFGEVHKPLTYLQNCLTNPAFKFSSSPLYDLPPNATKEDVEHSFRRLMLDYLDSSKEVTLRDFPFHLREEAEFLTEAYHLLFECFQPSDLLRYHQNTQFRFPPYGGSSKPPVIQPLPQVIRQRLDQLIKEAQEGDPTKDLPTLLALSDYAERWKELNSRSLYDDTTKLAIQQADSRQERDLLLKFRKLVDQAYFLSNGKRSCRTVLLTETDPDLTVGTTRTDGKRGQDTLEQLFHQVRTPSDSSNLAWPDICEIALTVREIDLRDRALTARRRARLKEAATGLGYTTARKDTLASRLAPKTSEGTTVSIAPTQSPQGAETLEIHKTKA